MRIKLISWLDIAIEIPELKKEEKFAGADIILPIPCIDQDTGKSTVLCKNILDITSEELLLWTQEVLPVNKDSKINQEFTKAIYNSSKKARVDLFNIIVKMHTNRWLFNQGPENIEKNN